jgi:signal transduction histidine kinase/ActR/RegA family two-component response regulator
LVAEPGVSVFQLDRGRAALEKYAAANHLTVEVYGADGRLVAGPVNRTPLFDVFSRSPGPGLFATCARQCLSQSDPASPVVVAEPHGLAVVGTTLVLGGQITGAAVAGYALTSHLSYREVVRLARDSRLPFDDVWAVTRKELPVSSSRLPLRAELLGILANTLLIEDYRSRQLEETSLRLAEASEAKDRFLAVLSHELRTPLTAILGYAAIVRMRKLDPSTDRALAVIERNAKLQTQLIEDLLDVSRIVSGSLRLELRPMALGPVIEAAVASASPGAHTKQVRLDLALEPTAAMISGDPLRMQQIVSNLVVNALKFTPAGGRIEVRLERRGDALQLVVHDTGIGIRAEFLPYVFERFRQEATAEAQSHRGLGLGLAIVRHLVELHSGSIEAESAGVGQGSTFTVILPALKDVEPTDLEPPLPTVATSPLLDEPTLKGLRVLVVDDDYDARDVFTRALEQYDARVTAVASAGAALVVLQHWKPHVVVSDIAMPEESGYVLMRAIRGLTPEEGGMIPALALTAYAGADDVKLALSAGFSAHVAKPIEPVGLALAVADLARGITTSS